MDCPTCINGLSLRQHDVEPRGERVVPVAHFRVLLHRHLPEGLLTAVWDEQPIPGQIPVHDIAPLRPKHHPIDLAVECLHGDLPTVVSSGIEVDDAERAAGPARKSRFLNRKSRVFDRK